jgi:hypothetical protein
VIVHLGDQVMFDGWDPDLDARVDGARQTLNLVAVMVGHERRAHAVIGRQPVENGARTEVDEDAPFVGSDEVDVAGVGQAIHPAGNVRQVGQLVASLSAAMALREGRAQHSGRR